MSNLTNSVKDVPGAATSGGVSALQSQLTKIKDAATKAVNSAKSDFPTETSALSSSVQSLETAVKGLPSKPSAAQIAGVATAGGRELGQELRRFDQVQMQLIWGNADNGGRYVHLHRAP